MLESNFYKIESSEIKDDSALFTVSVRVDHAIFDGHFPNNPIVPGVVQMEMLKELLSLILKKKLRYVEVRNCKFVAILNPTKNSVVIVKLNWTFEDGNSGNKLMDAIIYSEDVTFMKLNAKLGPFPAFA